MKSAQASGTTAMSEARLQQLCNQHGLYTWAEGQALAHEICRLRSAPAHFTTVTAGSIKQADEFFNGSAPAQPDPSKTQGCLCWHAIEMFDGIHHDQRCQFYKPAQPEQGAVDNPETWKGIGEQGDEEEEQDANKR